MVKSWAAIGGRRYYEGAFASGGAPYLSARGIDSDGGADHAPSFSRNASQGEVGEEPIQVHATCVELAGIGVLLRGPSGSGKSDLALRLIDAGARLVADDRVDITRGNGRVYASPPAALAGLMELRGVGILRVPAVARARVGLVIDLVRPAEVPRLPERQTVDLDGIPVPALMLAPCAPSAAAKVRLAARAAAADILFAEEP